MNTILISTYLYFAYPRILEITCCRSNLFNPIKKMQVQGIMTEVKQVKIK